MLFLIMALHIDSRQLHLPATNSSLILNIRVDSRTKEWLEWGGGVTIKVRGNPLCLKCYFSGRRGGGTVRRKGLRQETQAFITH